MRLEQFDILRCPETQARLSLADRSLIDQLNAAIAAGRIRNRVGQRVDEQMSGGLIREDGDVLYPVIDDIPVMLVDEGIDLSQLEQ